MRGDGDTFCYNAEQLRQDPLSHHLIVNLYTGAYGPEDPSWGGFHCDGGALDGQTCDPTVKDACGAGVVLHHRDQGRASPATASARPTAAARRCRSPARSRPTRAPRSPTAPTAACRSRA